MPFSVQNDIAIHEAAHAVVGHEVGGTVKFVDIGGGPQQKRKTTIDWQNGLPPLEEIDWLEEAEAEKARAAARNAVTCFVAGVLAEKTLKPDVQLLSKRITDQHFAHGGRVGADIDTVVYLLCQIHRPDITEVEAAELRAKEILALRASRLSAITDHLLDQGYVTGKELSDMLSL